jgi:hypothetical protein
MGELLAQIVLLAARGDEDIGWVQILVFVVVVVIYALGSIIKAKANKIEQGEQEQMPGKPGGKSPGVRGRLLARGRVKPSPTGRRQMPQAGQPRRRMTRPRPVAQRAVPEMEQALEYPTPTPSLAAELGVPAPLKEADKLISKSVERLEDEEVGAAAQIARTGYLAEILSDYADSEEIRRAILHYEILGKPLSLRSPSERIIEF